MLLARLSRSTLFLAAALVIAARPAGAIPVFADRFGVSCDVCHTIVPRLTAAGERFRDAGYRWPAPIPAHRAFPIAAKVNLAFSSAADPGGLPKAIVDETELLTMGDLGKHVDFRIEQYVLDGGHPGSTRDLYLRYVSDPLSAWRAERGISFDAQVGRFTLPLPNDPETFRPTETHYAVFDQTIGNNPFNFFDDQTGVDAGVRMRDVEIRAVLAARNDRMFVARIGSDALALWSYRYEGTRTFGSASDAFARVGSAVTSRIGRARTSLLLQTGDDSNPDSTGLRTRSSGGYLQEEWQFSPSIIGALRYDGTAVGGNVRRSTTISLNLRPYRRVRFTIEDVIVTNPRTSHTLDLDWLFAY